ncbi:MAG: hypothetical protein ACRDP9_26840 [Kribbellaceae bacterium]
MATEEKMVPGRLTRTGSTTTAARCVALAIVLVMVFYFLTSDAIRSGNPFLVPDALLAVFLLTAAVLPRRWAVPALIFALAWAAAVFTVSLCTYIVRGEFADGADHIALIVPCVAMAAWLAYGVGQPGGGAVAQSADVGRTDDPAGTEIPPGRRTRST